MTGESFLIWIAIAAGAFWLSPMFRRAVNGLIVQIADKVKHDADVPVKRVAPDMHITEDVGFMMFEEDFPNDPRGANGWKGLPQEIRQHYLTRALESLVGIEGKPYVEPEKAAL